MMNLHRSNMEPSFVTRARAPKNERLVDVDFLKSYFSHSPQMFHDVMSHTREIKTFYTLVWTRLGHNKPNFAALLDRCETVNQRFRIVTSEHLPADTHLEKHVNIIMIAVGTQELERMIEEVADAEPKYMEAAVLVDAMDKGTYTRLRAMLDGGWLKPLSKNNIPLALETYLRWIASTKPHQRRILEKEESEATTNSTKNYDVDISIRDDLVMRRDEQQDPNGDERRFSMRGQHAEAAPKSTQVGQSIMGISERTTSNQQHGRLSSLNQTNLGQSLLNFATSGRTIEEFLNFSISSALDQRHNWPPQMHPAPSIHGGINMRSSNVLTDNSIRLVDYEGNSTIMEDDRGHNETINDNAQLDTTQASIKSNRGLYGGIPDPQGKQPEQREMRNAETQSQERNPEMASIRPEEEINEYGGYGRSDFANIMGNISNGSYSVYGPQAPRPIRTSTPIPEKEELSKKTVEASEQRKMAETNEQSRSDNRKRKEEHHTRHPPKSYSSQDHRSSSRRHSVRKEDKYRGRTRSRSPRRRDNGKRH